MKHISGHRQGAWRSRGPARYITAGLAVALGATLAGVAAPAAQAANDGGEFSSSFESSDPDIVDTGLGTAQNVSGSPFRDGSVLGDITNVTASNDDPPKQGAPKAADGDPSTKWLAFNFHSPETLTYELGSAHAVDTYTLTSGADSGSYPGRDPEDWTVKGSDDGSDWTTIDTQTGQSFSTGGVTKSYSLNSPVSYRYYQLSVSKIDGASLIQLADFELYDSTASATPSDITTKVGSGPSSGPTIKSNVGFTGLKALKYAGKQLDADAHSTKVLYDNLGINIGDKTELSYKIFPTLDTSDLTYPSTYAAVDLVLDDGSRVSEKGLVDQNLFDFSATSYGKEKALYGSQWNYVDVDLSSLEGKTIDQIVLTYDNPGGKDGTTFSGWVDDIAIGDTVPRDTSDGLVDYVDTRRGSNANGSFSRGNTMPAAAVPNGFNFFTPMTNADNTDWLYQYAERNNSDNNPELQAIGISHEPSPWMGDRNQVAIMPAEAGSGAPSTTPSSRALAFRHEDETARPDLYSVKFLDGIKASVAPTDHAGIYKFEFPADEDHGSVVVDQVKDGSNLNISSDGAVTGWVDSGSGLSAGRSRMFVSGQFSETPTDRGSGAGAKGDKAQWAKFDTATNKTVELRIATSFISQDQADKNRDLEVTGESFSDVRQAATDQWNDRLGVIDLSQSDANDNQKLVTYSNLYRLNLYPNSQSENTGTAANPEWKYASPVSPHQGSATDTETNAQIKDGQIYVNNGFWDTYRTAWPLYAFLYPDVAAKLVDGFVQQYKDGGWIARWSSPGYADLMTGTSSDAAFAEAYTSGALDTDDALEAYDAALKNATVKPTSSAVGRKGLSTSPFIGYTSTSTGQSVSWGLEDLINDHAIGLMAQKLADDPNTPADRVDELQTEAGYLLNRSNDFVNFFDPDAGGGAFDPDNTSGDYSTTGFFQGRNPDGSFQLSPEDYDPTDWGNGSYTESDGWNFAFHAPYDVPGLAGLLGGNAALVNKLDEFFATPETASSSGIHEAKEARSVRMGQFGMSNQVSHHIPWLYAEAGVPAKTEAKVREVLQRLFVGSQIGQGYPGDEDNGEMSSWQVFASLGFYPLSLGSGQYTIGSPLYDTVTVHRGSSHGGDLTINANGNSMKNIYVSSVKLDGTPVTTPNLDQDALRSANKLDFTMTDDPNSGWGTDAPDPENATPSLDQTQNGFATVASSDDTDVAKLVDDDSSTTVSFDSATPTITSVSTAGAAKVTQYTLTDGTDGNYPTAWTLEGSDDGSDWTTIDTRTNQTFAWDTQTRPFSVTNADAYKQYRLHITETADGKKPTLAEFELLFSPASAPEDVQVLPRQARARTDVKTTGTYGVITGGTQQLDDYTATVDFRDGDGPQSATLERGQRGIAVQAKHKFSDVGVHQVDVKIEGPDSTSATTVGTADVYRDDTISAEYDASCLSTVGIGASCDGQGYGYDKAQLADPSRAGGLEQGKTKTVPGTDLSFTLPVIADGEPDNVTDLGQTFPVYLGDDATQFSFIGTANEKAQDETATVTYTDDSTDDVDLAFGDWVGNGGGSKYGPPKYGNIIVGYVKTRLSGTGLEGSDKQTALFSTVPIDIPAGKTVKSITLPTSTNSLRSGRLHVFTLASDSPDKPVDLTATAADSNPPDVVQGESADLDLASFEGGYSDNVSAVVSWGDGSASEAATVNDGAVTGEHTYADQGTYKATVTIDDGVKSTEVTRTVVVSDEYAPSISVDPTEAVVGQSLTVTGDGFARNESVDVTLTKGSDEVDSTTVTSGEDRSLEATLTVPESADAGDYTVTATGETSQTAATADVTVQVEKMTTTTTLAATPSNPNPGDTVSLTATVTGDATGDVEFFDGSTSLGSDTITGGTASVTTPAMTAGEHTFRAEYAGTSRYEASSDEMTITVSKRDSTVAVTSSAAEVTVGDPVTFTAMVTAGASGDVEFREGSTVLGTATLTNGLATFTVSSLDAGEHQVRAVYAGDDSFEASVSDAVTVSVGRASVGLSRPILSATDQVADAKKKDRASVSVAVAPISFGNVTFYDGAQLVGMAPIVGGQATLVLPRHLATGTHYFTASVAASPTHEAAVSSLSRAFTVSKTGLKKFTVKGKKKTKKHHKSWIKVKVSKRLTNDRVAKGKVKIKVKKHGSFKNYKKRSMKKFRTANGKLKIKIAKRFATGKKVRVKAVYKPKKSQKAEVAKSKGKVKIKVKK